MTLDELPRVRGGGPRAQGVAIPATCCWASRPTTGPTPWTEWPSSLRALPLRLRHRLGALPGRLGLRRPPPAGRVRATRTWMRSTGSTSIWCGRAPRPGSSPSWATWTWSRSSGTGPPTRWRTPSTQLAGRLAAAGVRSSSTPPASASRSARCIPAAARARERCAPGVPITFGSDAHAPVGGGPGLRPRGRRWRGSAGTSTVPAPAARPLRAGAHRPAPLRSPAAPE